MEWREEGTVLSARAHGEAAAIVEIFTATHGRHAGIVRGGTGRKMAPTLQPGAQVDAAWRARLEDHLGVFQIEPLRSRSADVMSDRLSLSGLNSVTGLLGFALPERAAYPDLYSRTQTVLDLLGTSKHWPFAYLRWELALLDELGFGLDLSECASTGRTDDLCYVSPKSGRAVSRSGAGQWADRLLPLPTCLLGEPTEALPEILIGLGTTGYFLDHRLRAALGDRPLPPARARLLSLMARS
jgi:DNA repair protein RecO (recombination protein O)